MRQILVALALIVLGYQSSYADQLSCSVLEPIIVNGGTCPNNKLTCSCTEYVEEVTYNYPAGFVCSFPVQVFGELMVRDTFHFNESGRLSSENLHLLGSRLATNLDSDVSIELPIANQWRIEYGESGLIYDIVSFVRTGLSWLYIPIGEGVAYAGIGYFDVVEAEVKGIWDGDIPLPFFNQEFCDLLTPP